MVQVNVREHWRNDPTLRGSGGCEAQEPIFQDACFQPLVDHSPDYAVCHSLVEDGTQLGVWNKVEVLSYINF